MIKIKTEPKEYDQINLEIETNPNNPEYYECSNYVNTANSIKKESISQDYYTAIDKAKYFNNDEVALDAENNFDIIEDFKIEECVSDPEEDECTDDENVIEEEKVCLNQFLKSEVTIEYENSADLNTDKQLQTNNEVALGQQPSTSSSTEILKCNICNITFNVQHLFEQHILTHTSYFKCHICNKVFIKRTLLIRHLKIHHMISDDPLLNIHVQIHNDAQEIKCETCGKQFQYKSKLNRHIRTHIDGQHDRNIRCEICKRLFSKSGIEYHLKTHNSDKKFVCPICNKAFLKNNQLTQHLKIHSGVKEFECMICTKSFSHKYQLSWHMATHMGLNFKCDICGKTFLAKVSLTQHLKIHSTVRDFKCDVCNKEFIRNADLKLHMTIHNAVKEFKCSTCNNAFTNKYTLNRHVRKKHILTKDFKCEICTRAYICAPDLKQHMKIHTGIKDMKCEICDKTFFFKKSLRAHLKVHIDVKEVECHICNKMFKSSSLLTAHLKSHEKPFVKDNNLEIGV